MPAASAAAPETALYPPRVGPARAPARFPFYLLDVVRNPLSAWPAAVYEQEIVATQERFRSFAWVCAPDLVKTVLLDEREHYPKTPIEKRVLGPLLGNGVFTADGADWKWQRHVVAPLFRQSELLRYVPAMAAAAAAFADDWAEQAPGAERAIDRDMAALTFKIIADTILPGGDAFVARAIERARSDYLRPISWEIAAAMVGLPTWVPHPGTFSMRRAERDLRGAVLALVSARRRTPLVQADLFQRLIDARHPETAERMSDALIVDNLLTFLAAGHATTAMALTWTLYLLARAPLWAARLEAEVDAVTGAEPIGAEHIDHLPLTQQVLKESLRLYPPAPVVLRAVTSDRTLGGLALRAGTSVIVPIYAIHRHKRLWQDPDRFDPDRFRPEVEARLSRYQFMPFGAGPRICVGMSFAMIEATVVLATLLRRFRLAPVPGCDPEPISRLTLRPSGGMRLFVRRR